MYDLKFTYKLHTCVLFLPSDVSMATMIHLQLYKLDTTIILIIEYACMSHSFVTCHERVSVYIIDDSV